MLMEAERVILRDWQESDVDSYLLLARDVGYNCFSPPGFYWASTAEEARAKIDDRIVLFRERRLGKFPIFLKETGEFIGTCGLGPFQRDGYDEVELGYRLCLKHWGKGYANEAATLALRYGFGDLDFKKIFAFALPQNRPSLRVLEKLGFRYLSEFMHAEMPHRLYKLPRERFGA